MVSEPIARMLIGVSMCLAIAGTVPYVCNTLRGKTQPNLVTWVLWAAVPLIAAAASISAGADHWAAVRTMIAGITPMSVVIASLFNPRSFWRLGPFDLGCGVLAVLALLAWLFTNSPRVAVLLAATADGLASLPTLRKAWKNPASETRVTYLVGLVSTCVMLPSIPVWNIEHAAFPIYLLAINSSLVFATYRGGRATK